MNEISQTFLIMTKTINTESFIEAWEGERCLWYVNSVIYENHYEKATGYRREERRSNLSNEERILVLVLASRTNLD